MLAEAVARIAAAGPDQQYCSSFLLYAVHFESETIETLEVGWGTSRTTILGELVRINIEIGNATAGSLDVRQILSVYVVPFVECFWGILQDTPGGFVVLAGNHGAVKDCHTI